MKYMFTDISTHIDLGFGVTASNFRDTAEFLNGNYKDSADSGFMPILYLYRHSVELYLKSLITIIHRKLKIPYKNGDVPYDSEVPFVKLKANKWREITKCHDIFTLYNYFVDLVESNKGQLNRIATDGNWNIVKTENQQHVNIVKNYDFDSTYFRYPFTKNKNADKKKYSNEMIDVNYINSEIDSNKPTSFLLVFNGKEDLVEAHKKGKLDLGDLKKAIKELSYYFSGIHVMARMTLCDGF